jgi:tetratricopeptide (TPR) repeat protein
VLAALATAASGSARTTDVEAAAPSETDPAVRAGELFRDGEFEKAAAAFAEAYARTGDPALLFGRAQALRRAGNCGAAIEVFEQFIATSPPAADVQAARDVIEACRSILGEEPTEPEPHLAAPQATPEPDPPPPPRPRWHRDVAGGVLLGSGLAVAATGAALYGTAFGRAGEPPAGPMQSEQAYEARQRSIRTLAATGGGLLIGGTALLVGSVVRYAIVARRERARREVARQRAAIARRHVSPR